MAKTTTQRMRCFRLVILCLCLCSLAVHLFANDLEHFGWESTIETGLLELAHDDHHEDHFLLPGVDVTGVPGDLMLVQAGHNLDGRSFSLSPQLPPPKS